MYHNLLLCRSTYFSGKYAVKREELLITIGFIVFEFSDLHAHYVYVVNNKIDGCLTPHIFAAFILVFGWAMANQNLSEICCYYCSEMDDIFSRLLSLTSYITIRVIEFIGELLVFLLCFFQL